MTGGRRTDRDQHLRVGVCASLSGRYARFGNQVLRGLEAWQSLDGDAELVWEDDASDPHRLEAVIANVAAQSDVLLGPYSTQLMRPAGRFAADADWLLWNHGGSGDDVEAAHPGHIVSVLTPTSRYSETFLQRLSKEHESAALWIVGGRGRFGRQVADGAEAVARKLGIDTVRISHRDELSSVDPSSDWDLFSADTFEDDVRTVRLAQGLPRPPRMVCAVAAGVREFAHVIDDPEGIFGVGQWFPRSGSAPRLGPTERDFLTAYAKLTNGQQPDYPAVQAAAGAVLATYCARRTNSVARDTLWSAATELDTETLFGGFRINPVDGTQIKHEAVLVRWTQEGLAPA